VSIVTRRIPAAFLLLTFILHQVASPRILAEDNAEYDLVIYGGTSAAVIAAVQAKRMGNSVVVVSPDKHLGGLSSGGLGFTDTGDKSVIGGLSREFYHRIWKHYNEPKAWKWQAREEYGNRGQGTPAIDGENKTMWIFEPSVAEQVFEDFVEEYELTVHRDEWLDREEGVEMDGTRIRAITTLSGNTYRGKMFIDATYEGDLMAAAGASFHVGRESCDTYDEMWNGVQVGVLHHTHYFMEPVDPYVEPGNPESGLLPRISDEPPGEKCEGDHRVQAYCFRMCLSNHPENRVPFPKPEGYDPGEYELLLREFATGRRDFFNKYDPIPNRKTDTNNHGAFSTDNIGYNYDYPEASYERRREIIEEHEKYQQGLMYFVANDPRVPSSIQERMAQWGLAADEFVDNEHWPHQIYVREARRLVGEYVMTEHDCLLQRKTPDPVGMGSYTIDSHNVQRYVTPEGTVQNEGDIGVRTPGPYQIGYGSLTPKRDEVENLLVPVCVSSSHIAFGSIRMEPVFMILGQSAATAASMAIEDDTSVQEVSYEKLAEKLLEDGQVLESPDPYTSPEDTWEPISAGEDFTGWREGHEGWTIGGNAKLKPAPDRGFEALPGTGVFISRGDDDLVTEEEFVDVEVRLEFMIGRRSNSGVKMNGLYEVQILDSAGKTFPTGSDCGGIYPRGERKPRYHIIDEGYPPHVNAAKPAGEWQTLEIAFYSPRFNNEGEKVRKARFKHVILNGALIHRNVELEYPTGAAWRLEEEVPAGPILLQGDHGPVAFRNIRVRALE